MMEVISGVDAELLISSGGEAQHIINEVKSANESEILLVTFLGFSEDNKLRETGKINFWCVSSNYNVVEITDQAS